MRVPARSVQTACGARKRRRSAAVVSLQSQWKESWHPESEHEDPRLLWVSALGRHVTLHSSATYRQLKLLSAIFQMCPQPTSAQVVALSRHVSIAPEHLNRWFQSRRELTKLQHMQASCVAELFY